MKLLKDYAIKYHLEKANLAVDALSRKPGDNIASLLVGSIEELIVLRGRNMEITAESRRCLIATLYVRPVLR